MCISVQQRLGSYQASLMLCLTQHVIAMNQGGEGSKFHMDNVLTPSEIRDERV